ncbi:hypothetical protein M409DRAFT_15846 [Zasmidium cellare ATCC 36951]|uniref:GST N-terminal domain-containing protein n=1 Tax=Zasmidium cellare ATCC 36951 TaxID=1080233 RepID=A0A6A6D7F6_ZASCE|nr:uncharacterized protein M409DRAFT_15846 [Zasmidium cellare ATCC 36951]KAF2173566.1 hypothetical protein M409DRAFT_15846 [Zasmidium cellare ATCC 36951]
MTPQPKPRLWVLPFGLYPRRVTIYLEEKGIADRFEIIPVNVTTNGLEEVEGKPSGTVPILEISCPTAEQPGKYIFQSTAILEYLEDVYGPEGPDMRGSTPEARARMRECMDIVNEVTTWLVLYVQHGSSLYGMMREQSRETAVDGLERMRKALRVLEGLADEEGPFLVGESPTLVDCILMATAQFAWGVYGVDLTARHERVKMVVDAFGRRGTAVFPGLPEEMKQMNISMSVV